MTAEIFDKTTAYTNLASAVVIQAVEEYRAAKLELSKNPNSRKAKGRLKKLTRFFESPWGNELCLGRADYILDRLQKEGENFEREQTLIL